MWRSIFSQLASTRVQRSRMFQHIRARWWLSVWSISAVGGFNVVADWCALCRDIMADHRGNFSQILSACLGLFSPSQMSETERNKYPRVQINLLGVWAHQETAMRRAQTINLWAATAVLPRFTRKLGFCAEAQPTFAAQGCVVDPVIWWNSKRYFLSHLQFGAHLQQNGLFKRSVTHSSHDSVIVGPIN